MSESKNKTASEERGRAAADERESSAAPDDHSLEEATEAIIFSADEPVEPDRIAEIVGEVTGRSELTPEDVEAAVNRLNKEYRESDRALQIKEWAGGYRMVTRSALSPFVKTLFIGEQETSLSRSLMETLAVIAYRQPVTRPEVDFIRGVNSDYAIRKLLEMGLADVEGRADSLGRPLLYGTTSLFLEQFGLASLGDLPTLREVEELLDDPAFDEERAKLLQLDAEEDISVDLPDELADSESEKTDSESSSVERFTEEEE
jgi:segregation and condensation protein B